MHVAVNGTRLYVDVEGAELVPDGAQMRRKPTLVLLHGGPGFDHTMFKPFFSALSDLCQIVYYDHRGNGRSDLSTPEHWTLAQWGDDVKGLCDVLGIERPIVYGASFGGFVAQSYLARHPGHAAKVVLASTSARVDFDRVFEAFGRIGGDIARTVATEYWTSPTPERRQRYIETCVPLYSRNRDGTALTFARARISSETAMHFNGPGNEQGRMDFRRSLADVRVPTLVLGGELDPIMPIEFSETIARSLPPTLVRFERFANSGHGLSGDDPDRLLRILREFVVA